MNRDIAKLTQLVKEKSSFITELSEEIGKVIVGQKYMIDNLLIGLLTDGHILLEGVPGLAKTLTVKCLSDAIHTNFNRIQFTPDLLPADILGTMIYNQKESCFFTKKGPIFSNIILADEINRAPAKVQSALLEAMQERQITIGEETFKLDDPFLVLATQNPIEQEGTYPLPEAQVDRFMLKLKVGYPTKEEEKEIIRRMARRDKPEIKPVVTIEAIKEARQLVSEIYIDERVLDYITDIVFATRYPKQYKLDDLSDCIAFGASPRASICLTMAAKAHAFIMGKGFVSPEDVKMICYEVLRHRIAVTYEAEAEELTTDDIIRKIIETVDVP